VAHRPSSAARARANPRTTLTAREKRFVEEYQVDLNGKESAIRAGYSARTANKIAYELLQRPVVHEALKAAIDARSHRTQITQDRVLQELARVAFFDPRKLLRADGTPKPVNELDDDTAAALVGMDVLEEWSGQGADRTQVGMTKKLKLPNKVEALSLAMKHLGMLRERVEHSGPNGAPLPAAPVVPVFHITVAGDAKE
jgi:phage terminase small subunit